MLEIKRAYDGIMAVITSRDGMDVLLVQELTRSERTGKDIGDYAFPAESREKHETDPFETAARIFQEEINIHTAEFRSLLCFLDINQLNVGVMHFVTDSSQQVSIGTAKNEVANPSWFSLDQVRGGSIKVRQGVREVIDVMRGASLGQNSVIKTSPRFPIR